MTDDRLSIKYIPLEQCVEWEENPKRHDYGSLIESIERYGFKDPPKFEPALNGGKGGIVEGNGRCRALRMMKQGGHLQPRGTGISDDGAWLIPILFGVDADSEAVAQAYAIDHNNITMLGAEFTPKDIATMWESDYTNILQGLAENAQAPVSVDGDDLDELLNIVDGGNTDTPKPKIDQAKELQKQWGVEKGQVWELGRHQIICGDCTDKSVVRELMGGENADMVVTSPPYWNQREYSSWETFDDYMADMEKVWIICRETLAEGRVLFWNIGDDSANRRHISAHHSVGLENAGFTYRDAIIWYKPGFTGIRWTHQKQHNRYYPGFSFENLLVFQKGDAEIPTFESKDVDNIPKTNVWQIAVETTLSDKHSAPYPVALAATAIRCYSSLGAIILDPFVGSGTTIIACEQLGRECRALEIDPGYCAVAIQRFLDYTDIEPKLLEG